VTLRVQCPGCGAAADFDHVEQSAAEFCAGCDYPLFWALPDDVADDEVQAERSTRGAGVLDPSLRRRPGAAGRVVLGGEACRACGEPNPSNAVYCLRCGVELHPAPEPEPVPEPQPIAEPEPEPEPVPEPARVPIGVWIAAAVALAGLAVLVGVAFGARGVAVLLLASAAVSAAAIWWRQQP
jgi:hypothetical protein